MCVGVIVPIDTPWPKLEQLIQMEDANKHGGGVAWLQGGKVVWKKGLKALEIFKLLETIKPPALIHFRQASSGGESPLLCHPFPITPEASTALEGSADSVLIHNGTWGPWKSHLLHMAPFYCASGKKLPDGLWSDTRSMAFLTAIYGRTALVAIDEKVAILNKDGTFEKTGYWFEQEKHYYTNLTWEHKWSKKDDKSLQKAWEKAAGEDYYDNNYSGSPTEKKDTTPSSSGTYLSKEAEEANNACALIVKKEKGNDKVVMITVDNNTSCDLQIING